MGKCISSNDDSGTPTYIAPETLKNHPYDESTGTGNIDLRVKTSKLARDPIR